MTRDYNQHDYSIHPKVRGKKRNSTLKMFV